MQNRQTGQQQQQQQQMRPQSNHMMGHSAMQGGGGVAGGGGNSIGGTIGTGQVPGQSNSGVGSGGTGLLSPQQQQPGTPNMNSPDMFFELSQAGAFTIFFIDYNLI